MTDHDVRDLLERMASEEPLPFFDAEPLARRARRRAARNTFVGAIGVAAALALVFAGASQIRTAPPVPVDDGGTNLPAPEGIFSEVGGWIVFKGDGALRAIAPDGSDETVLLDERKLVALDWSPDGSRLLVKRYSGDLSVIEPDGSETTLVRDLDGLAEDASFSPDGATVVYTYSAVGPSQMWTIASDGSQEPRLILESDQRLHPGGSLSHSSLYEPKYSPDGTQIAYVDGWYDNTHSLRVVNADGTDVRVLIDATTPPFDNGHVRGVEWAPDGSVIAISRDGIYTVRPDGTDVRLLIPDAVLPAWSPDGSLIAYSPEDDGPGEHTDGWGVWVANADGSNPRMISAIGQVGPWNPGGRART